MLKKILAFYECVLYRSASLTIILVNYSLFKSSLEWDPVADIYWQGCVSVSSQFKVI